MRHTIFFCLLSVLSCPYYYFSLGQQTQQQKKKNNEEQQHQEKQLDKKGWEYDVAAACVDDRQHPDYSENHCEGTFVSKQEDSGEFQKGDEKSNSANNNTPWESLVKLIGGGSADQPDFIKQVDTFFKSLLPPPPTSQDYDDDDDASNQYSSSSNDPFDRFTGAAAHSINQGNDEKKTLLDQLLDIFSISVSTARRDTMAGLLMESNSLADKESFMDVMQVLLESMGEVKKQLDEAFQHISDSFHRFNMLQVWYFMQYEEQVKNAVWKRRRHRYLVPLPVQDAIQLNDGLYLSHLAYADSCHDIQHFAETVWRRRRRRHRGAGGEGDGDDTSFWTVRNCTTDAKPNQPAHFLLVRHNRNANVNSKKKSNPFRVMRQLLGNPTFLPKDDADDDDDNRLEVILVIRGTKHVPADLITDGMLQATSYRGAKAHYGILKAALWLVDHYRDDLRSLQESQLEKQRRLAVENGSTRSTSGRDSKMKLVLLGHSLGAGTAALAAMEFAETESEWLDAESIGYGTPALVSQDLSDRYKDIITTVVNDADAVPRMSGAVLANAWLRIVSYNWTSAALDDYRQLLRILVDNNNNNGLGKDFILDAGRNLQQWLISWCQDNIRNVSSSSSSSWPVFENERGKDDSNPLKKEAELVPPGTCIHLYRDGTTWQGNYLNCSFFDELEVVPHLLDDHMIDTGYYNGLLNFVRGKKDNVSWMFDNDLLMLPV
jgi:Lipase (class 3)